MFWTVKKKITMSQMGDELDNVSRLHVHGVCVGSAVLDNIRKDKFHFRIWMVVVVISNVHWRVMWMNGRLVGVVGGLVGTDTYP